MIIRNSSPIPIIENLFEETSKFIREETTAVKLYVAFSFKLSYYTIIVDISYHIIVS